MKFEIIKDRRELDIPEQPIITYQLVGDFGEDGTKTLSESSVLDEIYKIVEELNKGNLDHPLLELTTEELQDLKGISIEVVLTSETSNFSIISYDYETSAHAELVAWNIAE